jgi:PAS domain-containing protein
MFVAVPVRSPRTGLARDPLDMDGMTNLGRVLWGAVATLVVALAVSITLSAPATAVDILLALLAAALVLAFVGTRQSSMIAALRASEARFHGIISIAADAIISVNSEQRIVLFNRGAEEIFGYAADDVLGEPLDILLPDQFRDAHTRHIVEFGRSGAGGGPPPGRPRGGGAGGPPGRSRAGEPMARSSRQRHPSRR